MDKQKTNAIKAAWNTEHIDRIYLAVPKGEKDRIREAAAASNESLCTYILKAVHLRMESDQ